MKLAIWETWVSLSRVQGGSGKALGSTIVGILGPPAKITVITSVDNHLSYSTIGEWESAYFRRGMCDDAV